MSTKRIKQKAEEGINVEETLAMIKEYMGFVPKIFQVLSENPSALKVYFEKSDMLAKDDVLPPLTKEFISIGAASALGAEHCLKTHSEVAKQFGATDNQIFLAIMIAGTLGMHNPSPCRATKSN